MSLKNELSIFLQYVKAKMVPNFLYWIQYQFLLSAPAFSLGVLESFLRLTVCSVTLPLILTEVIG